MSKQSQWVSHLAMMREEFLRRARELRAEADAAEQRLLEFLYEGERQRDIWADTGKTYPEFIESANLCKAVRYLAYKRVREGLGAEAVANVGAHAVVAAGALSNPKDQKEVLDRARLWEKSNGTAISEQSARRIASEAKVRSVMLHTRAKGYAELAEENERLKAENERLAQENAMLRAELKKLRPTNGHEKANPARSPRAPKHQPRATV